MRRATLFAGLAALALAASAPAAFASATSGPVNVLDTETVQVYANADGHIQSRRVYEQLELTGHGHVRLSNPVGAGLRNLDGFGGVNVVDGRELVDTTVEGHQERRTVNDYTGSLPLSVSVSYTLDGKPVKASDIVGRSGHLEVSYTVENVSGKPTLLTFPDGRGGTVTKTESVPVPLVGTLTVTAPSSYRNVSSRAANMAGDGQGGTLLSFTMTLFPPIGSPKATFGYSADISNGVVPRATVSALPVDPLASPTFSSAATSYQSGADTGAQLADGAGQIDNNLLKLRDGAAQLLDGLIKLHDGADQLDGGLGQAAPGARKLATGLGQADDGGKQLSAGASKLAAGQKSLADGLQQLHDGVATLPATVQKQVNADPQFQALSGALLSVIVGIGSPNDAPTRHTLMGGLNALGYGLRNPAATPNCANPATCGVLDGIDAIKAQLSAQGPTLGGALAAIASSTGCRGDQVCAAAIGGLTDPATGLAAQLHQVITSLGQLSSGGDQLTSGIGQLKSNLSKGAASGCASNPASCGVLQALQAVQAGVPTLVSMISQNISSTLLGNIGDGGKGCDPTKTLQCGANALLSGGAQLSAGSAKLSGGLGQLDAGARQLAGGLGQAKGGTGQLAGGLGQAAGGAPQLVDGAHQLSVQGTQKLVQAGATTAQTYGEMVAVIKAGAQRAQHDAMVYGAPEGATGLAAFSFVLQGDDGAGSRNVQRGLLAGGLLIAGAGGVALRRRFVG